MSDTMPQPLRLIPIARDGAPEEPVAGLPDGGSEAFAATAKLYETLGFEPPWIGYVALAGQTVVGTCAFKGPPDPAADGRVEIAYFTFPGGEGRGHATAMANALVAVARDSDTETLIAARTLPELNASTRVLEKLGFYFVEELEDPEDGRVWEWRLAPQRPAPPPSKPGGNFRPRGRPGRRGRGKGRR